jgi:pilus assembly protein FimV
VERAYFLTSIEFDVQVNARGEAMILISSEDPVLEPYLDFIVEARWPTGRLLREYTVLVDPPLFDSATPIVSASQRVEEVEGIPAPGPEGKKSQDPAAASGTRVDVKKKSTLAPGEMPQRGFNAQTTASPSAGARYMIHRNDTLWEIASNGRPEGVSVHQAMLDIQRMNPDAFIDGNINRIKAGYIIYLPTEDDISSQDLSAALAEVRQQNEDWEAGRASKPIPSAGPKLRISADPVETASDDAAETYTPSASATGDELAAAEREQAEMAGQLSSMEQQVETLQRIVSLKDDQIAALQNALADAGGANPVAVDAESVAGGEEGYTDTAMAGEDVTDGSGVDSTGAVEPAQEPQSAAQEIVAAEPEPAAEVAPPAQPEPAAAAEESSMSTLFYGLGAVILALLAFLFLRRRKDDEEQERVETSRESVDQAFAAVELKEQAVEAPAEEISPLPEFEPREEPAPAPVEEFPAVEDEKPVPEQASRGYGERKHDEYASDVETSDALAEADIYIAYGRYPQAVDLLKNAVAAEPSNPTYRLKLLELHLQMDDQAAADNELRELEAIGDEASLERARAVMGSGGVDMSEPPAGLAEELGGALESDFAGLEIESSLDAEEVLADDLDLSSDFTDDVLPEDGQEEDLVIAAEANGMSTKLDLARAYLDMGDDDGARQILEEVVAEGTEVHKAEATELLERIG